MISIFRFSASILPILISSLITISYINSHTFDNSKVRDSLSPIEKFPLSSSNQVLVESGKQQYEVLLERKRNSIYGQCWANAILKLERSCNQLDEYRQSWLSILFTHCFLKTSGFGVEFLGGNCFDLIESDVNENFNELIPQVKECTRTIDLKIFNTYSLFFVHTQSICFYLQSEQWQKHTENLVDNLVHSAHEVSVDLNSAVSNIRQLEVLQNSSLKAQLSLNEELAQAKQSLSKFQEQTKEQRDLIEKIIFQFASLREFLMTEFALNSTIIYYIFAMIVIYFSTTTKRTSGIRLILYIILAMSFVLEKKSVDYLNKIDFLIKSHIYSSDTNLYDDFNLLSNVWVLRKIILFIMVSTYIWWAATYMDISHLSYRILNDNTILLKSIQKQLDQSPSRHLDYSDESDVTFSNYDGSSSDSVYSTDSDSPDDDDIVINRKYDLRDRSQSESANEIKLPNQYRNETTTDFVRKIRSSQKIEKLNFYSSDEN